MGIFRNNTGRSTQRHGPSSPFGAHFLSSYKRTGIELAGAFVFAGTLSAFAVASRPTNATQATPKSTTLPTSTVQLDTSPPTNTDPISPLVNSDSSSINNDNSSAGTADSATSSAKVTVNGQPVEVPDNGSVHKTISVPGGQATVDVSNNSTTTGGASSSKTTTSNLQVFSQSSSTGNTSIDINSSNMSP